LVAFGGPTPPTDEVNHGTHVAGTVGARVDTRGVVGMLPGVELWSLDISDGSGGVVSLGNRLNAYQFVINNANRITAVNMSFGGPFSAIENAFVDACVDAGVIMVAAAGNSSIPASLVSPASASKVVCVAALADSDGLFGGDGPFTSAGFDDTFAFFSNFGSAVDVIAPGVDIISTVPGNQYDSLSGTSMASPHICGLLARYSGSTVVTSPGRRRRATGLEIAALFAQVHGVERIFGPGGFYPFLTLPSRRH
jgi:subtilisin family serine protease